MKDLWLRIGGTLLVVASAYLFLSTIQQGFRPFEYAAFPIGDSLVSTEKEIGRGVSYALWDQRSLDMILLALLIFVTSACCVSLLSPQEDTDR
jgi:hypothetical protein